MKFINSVTILFSAFLFITFSASKPIATPANPDGISFYEGTWKEALDKAKDEKKLVFLDAFTSWCGPCKYIKGNVFTNSEVGSYFNSNFINVEKDMEKGEGRNLAALYNVTAYPTLLFVTPEGKIIKRQVGVVGPEQLITIAKSVREGA